MPTASGCRRSTRSARGCCGAKRRTSACRATSSSTTPPTRSPSSSRRRRSSASTTSSCRRAPRWRGSARRRTGWKAPTRCAAPGTCATSRSPRSTRRYLAALRESNALDFDDLLLKTVELFETAAPVRERYAHKFKYVMVDEYQDTNRPQYLLIKRLSEIHRNLCRRRRSGSVDLQVARRRPARTSSTSRPTSPTPPSSGSSRTTARRRSSSTPPPPSSSRTATARTSGCGPIARAAHKIVYFRGGDEIEEADFIVKSIKQARAEDVDTMMAVLYRTNAQSRAIEDQLMRESVPYKIIGGVRFYERKEIKDALAYLQADHQPARRCQPAARDQRAGARRRQGRDGLAAGDRSRSDRRRRAAAARRRARRRQLGALAVGAAGLRGRRRQARQPRDDRAAHVPRPASSAWPHDARTDTVSIAIGKMLDRSGYLQDLRDENTEEANERTENLMELVSAARDYEIARRRGLARRLRRSAVAAVGGRRGVGLEERARLADVDARRQGARVPRRLHRRHGRRPVPALALVGGRGRARGGATAVLRRHDASASGACSSPAPRAAACSANTSRPSRHAFSTRFRRNWSSGSRRPSRRSYQSSFAHAHYEFRTNPYGRGGRPARVREEAPKYSYEDEDQSRGPAASGRACAYATRSSASAVVLAVEEHTDDYKITVRFNSVGVKKLLARFAKLEPA